LQIAEIVDFVPTPVKPLTLPPNFISREFVWGQIWYQNPFKSTLSNPFRKLAKKMTGFVSSLKAAVTRGLFPFDDYKVQASATTWFSIAPRPLTSTRTMSPGLSQLSSTAATAIAVVADGDSVGDGQPDDDQSEVIAEEPAARSFPP